tara:strand:+ start:315 stop:989 length:675 start_codon:yes stop_codon:yes gene_type:complete
MADKTPIRLVFTSGTPTGIAEYQTGETIGIAFGGTGATTLAANSILTGNGTSAIQATSLQISGTTISTSDSTSIQINEAVDVSGALTVGGSATITGNLTVQGTTTTVNSTTIDVQNSLRFEGATADAHETTLTTVDPTADRTISLPNASGTIIIKDSSNNISQSIATLTATSFTDGSATMTSGSITGLSNVTGSGTANFTTDVQVNSISVATRPFAIAQAVALG